MNLNNDKMEVEEPYSPENEIKFCEECGCENFIEKTISMCETGDIAEYELNCDYCGNVVNYFSYGYFENFKSEKYLQEEKRRLRLKKISNILDE